MMRITQVNVLFQLYIHLLLIRLLFLLLAWLLLGFSDGLHTEIKQLHLLGIVVLRLLLKFDVLGLAKLFLHHKYLSFFIRQDDRIARPWNWP